MDMNLSKFGDGEGREACRAVVRGVAKIPTRFSDWTASGWRTWQIKALGQDHRGGNWQILDANLDLPYSELSALPETRSPSSSHPTSLLLTGWRRK